MSETIQGRIAVGISIWSVVRRLRRCPCTSAEVLDSLTHVLMRTDVPRKATAKNSRVLNSLLQELRD